jgi:hypothetical protein
MKLDPPHKYLHLVSPEIGLSDTLEAQPDHLATRRRPIPARKSIHQRWIACISNVAAAH